MLVLAKKQRIKKGDEIEIYSAIFLSYSTNYNIILCVWARLFATKVLKFDMLKSISSINRVSQVCCCAKQT
jgi:hypothetical protein